MNKDEAVLFLFNISREVKRSFESPVILLTQKDYSESIFKSLVEMRTALLHHSSPGNVAEIIQSFHLEWLQAILDIENFKKRVTNTPRETIMKSIEFTMECAKNRQKYLERYIEQLRNTMTVEEKQLMQTDLDTIVDMRDIVSSALMEKQKSLCYQADKEDFYVMIMTEIDELLNWLDKLNDHLAIHFTKALHLKIPLHPSDLTKTLQQFIDEVARYSIPEAKNIAEKLNVTGKKLGTIARVASLNNMEISRIIEKIKNLEDRINRLKGENSSAVVALEHKTCYLEERLRSLENLKLSLNSLKNQRVNTDSSNEDYRIFNHLLPHPERCRLVEQLIKLWDSAIKGDVDGKSIISILSCADINEVFSDEIGHFTVDKYGRKIYSKEGDDILYQLNENDELVPVIDDDKHVYFFDECGRYYLSENRERIYKAHENASEYFFHKAGMLLKFSEEDDGIRYFYDNLGRYYYNNEGKRIYRDKNSTEEYFNDGLGNLVRIRDEYPDYDNAKCPEQPMIMEENLYLKRVVGNALKSCLAQVVVAQPHDPIAYLAKALEQYWRNMKMLVKRQTEANLLKAARAEYKETISSPPSAYSLETVDEVNQSSTNYDKSSLS